MIWIDRTTFIVIVALAAVSCGSDGGNGGLDAIADIPTADTGWTPPQCHDPTQPGPYKVGFRDLLLDDPQRDGKLDSRMHYPAAVAGEGTEVDFSGAPYPLVILSHGFLMYPGTYDYLAAHLASHGFVVLGTKHYDSAGPVIKRLAELCNTIPPDQQLDRIAEVFTKLIEHNHAHRRVGDVSALIDAATAMNVSDKDLAGAIDVSRTGVVGHSFGAFTGLAASGAKIQVDAVKPTCKGEPTIADIMTQGIMQFLTCMVLSVTDDDLKQGPIDLRDERVSALVNMAGPQELIWGNTFEGLADVAVPVMLIYTDTDEAVPFETGPVLAWDVYPAPKYFLSFAGGNHANFGHIDKSFFDAAKASIPDGCA
ncbi:MAG: hypothetical protein GXP54_03505, partial [Deltaproteobacteria bacterium]|nr:hypothetical protein [Deltaproteobacteria bacterium]